MKTSKLLSFITAVLVLAACKKDDPLTLPAVTTGDISSITTTTATAEGKILNLGGSTLKESGVCFSTEPNPTTANTTVVNNSNENDFTLNLAGLDVNTTYYLRAYAINGVGTGYGAEVSFTTESPQLADLSATQISEITQTSAVCAGEIINDGGIDVTERGFCFSTSANPTVDDSKISCGDGIGSFNTNLIHLKANTLYYVRAYAINSAGTAYGESTNFTTDPGLATVSTSDVTDVQVYTASTGGNVTDDGGVAVTSKGVCISTAPNPTISDLIVDGGTNTGRFDIDLSDLTGNTTYYIRAYATNSVGTAYGEEFNFKTLTPIAVGQIYASGYVFFVDETGLHGLVASTSDQSTAASWGCQGTLINRLGTSGANNTASIINTCDDPSIAAKICSDYSVLGAYSGWFLPSLDELGKMYLQKDLLGMSDNLYWSSNETIDGVQGSYLDFTDGTSGTVNKDTQLYVRAIRAF